MEFCRDFVEFGAGPFFPVRGIEETEQSREPLQGFTSLMQEDIVVGVVGAGIHAGVRLALIRGLGTFQKVLLL